ncbi:MAG: DoxX family protein [Chloroflexota bacterium]
MRYRHWLGLGASIILGMIFLISGIGKLLLQGELFETYFPGFLDFLTLDQTRLLFYGLPYVEIAIGALLIVGFATKLIAALTSLLTAGFIASNVWFITHGMGFEPCGCLGIFDRLFQSKLSTQQSFYIDIAMLALILITLLCYQRSFTSIRPWFLKKN